MRFPQKTRICSRTSATNLSPEKNQTDQTLSLTECETPLGHHKFSTEKEENASSSVHISLVELNVFHSSFVCTASLLIHIPAFLLKNQNSTRFNKFQRKSFVVQSTLSVFTEQFVEEWKELSKHWSMVNKMW